MAGKWLDRKGGPTQAVRGEDISGAEECGRKSLVLMTCAVVGCEGPVYSLHVSTLHLFLGENKGVRMWSLRPLVKPCSLGKHSAHSKAKLQGSSEKSSFLCNKKLGCESCGRAERCQHVMDSSSALGKVHDKKSGNFFQSEFGAPPLQEDVPNMGVEDNMGGAALKKLPRKGFYSTREQNGGVSVTGSGNHWMTKMGSDTHGRLSNAFRSLSELQASLKMDMGLETSPREEAKAGNTTNMGDGVIKNETQNGISRSYSAQHGDNSIREEIPSGMDSFENTQKDPIVYSGPELVRSEELNGDFLPKIALRQKNGLLPTTEHHLGTQLGTSHMAKKSSSQKSGVSLHTTVSSLQTRMNMKEVESPVMWYIALNPEDDVVSSQVSSSAAPRPSSQLQVVDIQELGLKEYVVLDSKGNLHLLTLHEVREQHNLELFDRNFLTLRRLQSTLCVSSFAVLPPPPPLPQAHRGLFSTAAAAVKRKLWISDGMYSVHVVIVPEEKSMASIDSAALAVSQVVFMKERVDGLVSVAPDTIVVLMKGRAVSYVMAGD